MAVLRPTPGRLISAARLDQLPPEQRAVLDNAAVLGGTGRVDALERFGEELGIADTRGSLDALSDAGLLTATGTRWRFPSESVREVAYHTLTKAARAQRHAGVARALAEKASGRPDDIAHHLMSAAELVGELGSVPGVPSSIRREALRWSVTAARAKRDQSSVRNAIAITTRCAMPPLSSCG